MRIRFEPAPRPHTLSKATPGSSVIAENAIADDVWNDWTWQMRASLKTEADFAKVFKLAPEEEDGFRGGAEIPNSLGHGEPGDNAGREPADLKLFEVRTTPYYAALASPTDPHDPIRRILMPRREELHRGVQSMLDPLGEQRNARTSRIIHRYPDRVLFLVTDFCSVYCRYCTRKHFTGGEASFAKKDEYQAALDYIRGATGIREVILSGGDPLTLSDAILERVLTDLRAIDHVEMIRIGSRMPVVNPMRVTDGLIRILRGTRREGEGDATDDPGANDPVGASTSTFTAAKPVFLMTHFNHPRELTAEAARGLTRFVDGGIPVFNQMVLLNGVNNSAAIVQALSRRLLALRAKPYYMFQCDPSFGTDHLRTSIEESLEIQRELWGRLSGLAMPNLSLDIPDGGGKAGLTPNFEILEARRGNETTGITRVYEGWDGVRAEYKSPPREQSLRPVDADLYEHEWRELCAAKSSGTTPSATADGSSVIVPEQGKNSCSKFNGSKMERAAAETSV